MTNGALDDTFQDYNIHEPGVISESTVDGDGPFFRPRTITSSCSSPRRRTWARRRISAAATPNICEHSGTACRGGCTTGSRTRCAKSCWRLIRRCFSPASAGSTSAQCARITAAHGKEFPRRPPSYIADAGADHVCRQSGATGGRRHGADTREPGQPIAPGPNGKPLIDQLGTSNLAPLVGGGQINPALAANNIRVIKETHGKTSHLSAAILRL